MDCDLVTACLKKTKNNRVFDTSEKCAAYGGGIGKNVTAFSVCFCKGEGIWCMDDHVCNVLYNVNRFLCKDDHVTFCEGP